MGLDFCIYGVTLSKRKVENKGLQHFINNGKIEKIADEHFQLHFDLYFRRPDELMSVLLKDTKVYYDEKNEWCEGFHVLNQKQVLNLMKTVLKEENFIGTYDEGHYYALMSRLYELRNYKNKFNDFYLVMYISV